MRAKPEDKLRTQGPRPGGLPVRSLIIVVAIAVGLLLLVYSGGDEPPAPVIEAPPAPALPAADALPPAEDIPVRPEITAPPPEEQASVPRSAPGERTLPAPQDSDGLMRQQIMAAGADGNLAGFALGDHLLQRLVSLLDGASRGELLRKILPMQAPVEPFPVIERAGEIFVDPAGYARYNDYVEAVEALDIAAVVDSFHLLRPLYEAAYAELGLPAQELDNAVIRSLDRIIATPEISEPVALERGTVLYTYADPALESLPAVQKQLLRMGPDNVRRLKAIATELRNALLDNEA